MVPVLLVDDDSDFLHSLREMLADHECRDVLVASSGYEAIDTLKQNDVCLVVVDYKMENGDGISLANYCSDNKIPFFILTAYEESNIKPYIPTGTKVFHKVRSLLNGELIRAVLYHVEPQVLSASPN